MTTECSISIDNPDMSDITLVVGDRRFYVYKAILWGYSPVFKRMCTNGMKESTDPEIVLQNDPNEFEAFLRAIYPPYECNVTDDNVEYMLSLADFYGVQKLKDICDLAICCYPSHKNMMLAWKYNLKDSILAFSTWYARRRIVALSDSNRLSLNELPKKALVDILLAENRWKIDDKASNVTIQVRCAISPPTIELIETPKDALLSELYEVAKIMCKFQERDEIDYFALHAHRCEGRVLRMNPSKEKVSDYFIGLDRLSLPTMYLQKRSNTLTVCDQEAALIECVIIVKVYSWGENGGAYLCDLQCTSVSSVSDIKTKIADKLGNPPDIWYEKDVDSFVYLKENASIYGILSPGSINILHVEIDHGLNVAELGYDWPLVRTSRHKENEKKRKREDQEEGKPSPE